MANQIEYWLSYNNGTEKMRFPVHPESIEIESPFGFVDVEVTHLGEYSVFGERRLKSISFSSFFPEFYNSSYCEYADFPAPQYYVDLIEKWRDERKPLRLIVAGTNINMAVTVRDFSLEYERAGAIGDIYFTLSLKEYRPQNYREEVDLTKLPTKADNRPPIINEEQISGDKTYTVKSGDSLSKVFGKEWRKVYEANKSVIGNNPNIIRPGQKLVIPS